MCLRIAGCDSGAQGPECLQMSRHAFTASHGSAFPLSRFQALHTASQAHFVKNIKVLPASQCWQLPTICHGQPWAALLDAHAMAHLTDLKHDKEERCPGPYQPLPGRSHAEAMAFLWYPLAL